MRKRGRAHLRAGGEKEKVLARLKKPGGPLKTIRLMKYVKAHKETVRPLREVGSGSIG